MIPKRVIHDINCIWRAYLCSGEYYSQRPDNIKWDQVCTPKEAGGSEVRRIIRWNSTALGRYVRDVFAKKRLSLWLRWISAVYVQNEDWWTYVPHQASS